MSLSTQFVGRGNLSQELTAAHSDGSSSDMHQLSYRIHDLGRAIITFQAWDGYYSCARRSRLLQLTLLEHSSYYYG